LLARLRRLHGGRREDDAVIRTPSALPIAEV
jgi:hypothetical protein